MIIQVKTIEKAVAVVGFVTIILTTGLLWAWSVVFTDYPVRSLKVLEVNEEIENAVLESPDGETVSVEVGNVVGEEELAIVKISKTGIVLEGEPDDKGKTVKRFLPAIHTRSVTPVNIEKKDSQFPNLDPTLPLSLGKPPHGTFLLRGH